MPHGPAAITPTLTPTWAPSLAAAIGPTALTAPATVACAAAFVVT